MHATLTVLGSGTSMGVPTIGCDCAVCRSPDPRDRRTRPSVMVSYNGRHVMIDSTPDFREQALREKITQLDAVLYTHTHADHILGIDDLRPLTYHHKPGKLPLYATPRGCEFLRNIATFLKPSISLADCHRLTYSRSRALSNSSGRASSR